MTRARSRARSRTRPPTTRRSSTSRSPSMPRAGPSTGSPRWNERSSGPRCSRCCTPSSSRASGRSRPRGRSTRPSRPRRRSAAPTRPASSTASWEQSCARCARMGERMPPEVLDRIVDRLERTAAELRYSLLAGGKRIRPVLALATASALGRTPSTVVPLAAALELIHTYSLIHDDLPAMDDDDLRRGRPTCHVKYGEAIAILAGDGLFAEAFRHLLREQEGDPAKLLEAAAELAAATGVNGMVGGQYVDVRNLVPDGEVSLRRLHELKTGRLIAASVECVLLLTSGSTGSTRLPDFRAFAAELGVLFQIVDDILDVTGTEDALGKPQGSDE